MFENAGGRANWRAPAFLVCATIRRESSRAPEAAGRRQPHRWAASTSIHRATRRTSTCAGQFADADVDAIPVRTGGRRQYVPATPAVTRTTATVRRSAGARTYRARWCPAQLRQRKLIFAPDFSNAAFLKGLAAQENVKYDHGQLVPVDAAHLRRSRSPWLAYIMTRATARATASKQPALGRRRQDLQAGPVGGLLG